MEYDISKILTKIESLSEEKKANLLYQLDLEDLTGIKLRKALKECLKDSDYIDEILHNGVDLTECVMEVKIDKEKPKIAGLRQVANIFKKQDISRPIMTDIYSILESWDDFLKLINFPENSDIQVSKEFLHLSMYEKDSIKRGVTVNNTLCEAQFFITKGGKKNKSNNPYGGYDSSFSDKSWSKMPILLSHASMFLYVSELIKLSMYNLIDGMQDDVKEDTKEKITAFIEKVAKHEFNSLEKSECNYLSVNILDELKYLTTIRGQASYNLRQCTYNACFINTGIGNSPQKKASKEYINSLLTDKKSDDDTSLTNESVKPSDKPSEPIKPKYNVSLNLMALVQYFKSINNNAKVIINSDEDKKEFIEDINNEIIDLSNKMESLKNSLNYDNMEEATKLTQQLFETNSKIKRYKELISKL